MTRKKRTRNDKKKKQRAVSNRDKNLKSWHKHIIKNVVKRSQANLTTTNSLLAMIKKTEYPLTLPFFLVEKVESNKEQKKN